MKNWNILVADQIADSGLETLKSRSFVDNRAGISSGELIEIIRSYDALIVRSRTIVTAQIIQLADNLKVIGRAGVGVDNIDLDAARARNVIVVNTANATTIAVAELTLGLMLALARNIPNADGAVKRGEWNKKALMGVELHGKTLGIIGVGRIGTTVASHATALGMTVLGYDPLLSPNTIQQRGARSVPLETLYHQSDFISLHLPLTAKTDRLISKHEIDQMKPGVRLVSTARGGLIDEEALLTALASGHVAGAALDVFAQEPPGSSPLVTHPQVIATPHIGAQTQEAQDRVAQSVAGEVLAALSGEPLRWQVV